MVFHMSKENWTHVLQAESTCSSGSESVEHINKYQMNRKGKEEIILLESNAVVRK